MQNGVKGPLPTLDNFRQMANARDTEAVKLVDGQLQKTPAELGFFGRVVSWWRGDNLKTRVDLAEKVFNKYGGVGGAILLKNAGFDASSNKPLAAREVSDVFKFIDNRYALEIAENIPVMKQFDDAFDRRLSSNEASAEVALRMVSLAPKDVATACYAEKQLVDGFLSSSRFMNSWKSLNSVNEFIKEIKEQSDDFIRLKLVADTGRMDADLADIDISEAMTSYFLAGKEDDDFLSMEYKWLQAIKFSVSRFESFVFAKMGVIDQRLEAYEDFFRDLYPSNEKRAVAYRVLGDMNQLVLDRNLSHDYSLDYLKGLTEFFEKVKNVQREIHGLGGVVHINDEGFDALGNAYRDEDIAGVETKRENEEYSYEERASLLEKKIELRALLQELTTRLAV